MEKLKTDINQKTFSGKPQIHSGIEREKGEKPVFDRLYTAAQMSLQMKLQKQKEQYLAAKDRPQTARTKNNSAQMKKEVEEEAGPKSARNPDGKVGLKQRVSKAVDNLF